MTKPDKEEILAQLGQLILDREELTRQLANIDQQANQLKLQLYVLDRTKSLEASEAKEANNGK